MHISPLPLVTIVTPSLNQGRFIGATIASVLGQDYPHLEYQVIDGGSSDETLAVLRSFAGDPRLSWLSEPDRGQADAINKGWQRATGQILAWLNSDDTYLPGAVSAQVQALLAHPECGVVYGDAQYIDEAGRPLSRLYGHPFSLPGVVRLELPVQPTVFLRREVLEQAGPLDLSMRYALDTEFWVRAAAVAPFYYNSVLVATYRLHNASKSVAGYAGFYREWLLVAERFFASEQGRPYATLRNRLLADIYAAIANNEAHYGDFARALHYLHTAFNTGGPRPRMLRWLPALLDRVLPTPISPLLTQLWTALRSRGKPARLPRR